MYRGSIEISSHTSHTYLFSRKKRTPLILNRPIADYYTLRPGNAHHSPFYDILSCLASFNLFLPLFPILAVAQSIIWVLVKNGWHDSSSVRYDGHQRYLHYGRILTNWVCLHLYNIHIVSKVSEYESEGMPLYSSFILHCWLLYSETWQPTW